MTPPRAHRTCVVIAIGDELTLGQKLNTNSAWIADTLTQHGIEVLRHSTVDDDLPRLVDALSGAVRDADLVILTGGLGPTQDDLTREALCALTGDRLIEDPQAAGELKAWFRDRAMPESNRVQATRPSRARCLTNRRGTAPGLLLSFEGTDLFAMPGPPNEMKPMFAEHVIPRLRPISVVRTRVLHCVGLGEAPLAEKLGGLMDRQRNPLVGTTASGGIVSVRIRAHGEKAADVEHALSDAERAVREALGSLIISPRGEHKDHDTGRSALVRELIGLLEERAQGVSVCESCTAGLLAATIAEVPGSSAVLAGGFVTYSNELKASLAGVETDLIDAHGAVSPEVARAMASGTRQRTNTEHALAITGIAGPGGGSAHKPVGTVWIALDSEGVEPEVRGFLFKSDRRSVRERAVVASLAMLRQRLLGIEQRILSEIARESYENG